MAWFGRGEQVKPPPLGDRPNLIPESQRAEKSPAQTPPTDLTAHFYKGSRVTGKLVLHGAAEIGGSMNGEILCDANLTIGEGAEVHANIIAEVVVIRGHVEGDVTAKQRLELEAPGRLYGNVAAPRFVVAEGVIFDGNCAMNGAKSRREAPVAPDSNSEKALEGGSPKLLMEK
ncbi:MAG TPA: polymer-forming cytoskeletal protein [Verrucomicrobiae bacterium]|nr:polymer-forming cytoskeletal protein [Verrucomicrobiae bacterium]